MKIRNLLAVVAMLSVFLIGIGTASAVTGVNDAVPGQDIVFPIICEGSLDGSGNPVFGSLNTIWAIADRGGEVDGSSCTLADSVCTPHDKTIGVVSADVLVNTSSSETVLDTSECWSKRDVISNNCQALITQMSGLARAKMVTTIGGKSYFAGYVIYSQAQVCGEQLEDHQKDGLAAFLSDRFISWVYLQDVVKGFSAGMNGFSGEEGIDVTTLDEDFDIGVTAHSIFPRYFLLNDNAETFNWWIMLFGRNQYSFGPQAHLTRVLTGVVCDENENCLSEDIAVPIELNIINVADVLPALPGNTGITKAGFAILDIVESGFLPGESSQTTINGTMSFTDDNGGTIDTDAETYTFLGWAYQRALPVSSPAKISVLHEIHRTYCARGSGGNTQPYGPNCLGFTPDNQSYPRGTDDLPFRFSTCDSNNDFCDMTGPVPDFSTLPSD